jgi:predicted glutamine amidotransferase
MCGIAGFFGCVSPGDRKLICYANRSRGTEGWGIATWRDGVWTIKKKGEDIHACMARHDAIDWDAPVLLYHTRRSSPDIKAKQGGMADANSHPFTRGHITLAHNGYIRNWQDLIAVDRKDFVVDSDALSEAINEGGVEILKKVEGSAACWWIDDRDTEAVNLWVFNQEFTFVSNPDGGMAFSSEAPDLRLAELWPGAKIIRPKEGGYVRMGLNGAVLEARKIKAKKPVANGYAGYGGSYWFDEAGRKHEVLPGGRGERITYGGSGTTPPVNHNRLPATMQTDYSKAFPANESAAEDSYYMARAAEYDIFLMRPVCRECGHVVVRGPTNGACSTCKAVSSIIGNDRIDKLQMCVDCGEMYDFDVSESANKGICPSCQGKLSPWRSLPAFDFATWHLQFLNTNQLDYFFAHCINPQFKLKLRKWWTWIDVAVDNGLCKYANEEYDAKLEAEVARNIEANRVSEEKRAKAKREAEVEDLPVDDPDFNKAEYDQMVAELKAQEKGEAAIPFPRQEDMCFP